MHCLIGNLQFPKMGIIKFIKNWLNDPTHVCLVSREDMVCVAVYSGKKLTIVQNLFVCFCITRDIISVWCRFTEHSPLICKNNPARMANITRHLQQLLRQSLMAASRNNYLLVACEEACSSLGWLVMPLRLPYWTFPMLCKIELENAYTESIAVFMKWTRPCLQINRMKDHYVSIW